MTSFSPRLGSPSRQCCRIFIPCVIVLLAVVALAAFSAAMAAAVCSCARVTIVATGAMEKLQLQEHAQFYSSLLLLLLFPSILSFSSSFLPQPRNPATPRHGRVAALPPLLLDKSKQKSKLTRDRSAN